MTTVQFNDELSSGDLNDLMHGQGASDIDGDDDRHVCPTCLSGAGLTDAIAYFADGRRCPVEPGCENVLENTRRRLPPGGEHSRRQPGPPDT